MTKDQYHETWEPDPTDPGVMLYEFESAVGRHSRNDIPVARDAILKLIADLQAAVKAHHDWQMTNRPVEYGDSQLFHSTYTILKP